MLICTNGSVNFDDLAKEASSRNLYNKVTISPFVITKDLERNSLR